MKQQTVLLPKVIFVTRQTFWLVTLNVLFFGSEHALPVVRADEPTVPANQLEATTQDQTSTVNETQPATQSSATDASEEKKVASTVEHTPPKPEDGQHRKNEPSSTVITNETAITDLRQMLAQEQAARMDRRKPASRARKSGPQTEKPLWSAARRRAFGPTPPRTRCRKRHTAICALRRSIPLNC